MPSIKFGTISSIALLVIPATILADTAKDNAIRLGLGVGDGSRFGGSIGAEFRVLNLADKSESRSFLSLSIDSVSVSRNFGNGSNVVPILLNYVTRKASLYLSVGAGVGIASISGDAFGSSRESKTVFAYSAAIGADVSKGRNPLFVEIRYFGSSDTRVNLLGVCIGVRF